MYVMLFITDIISLHMFILGSVLSNEDFSEEFEFEISSACRYLNVKR